MKPFPVSQESGAEPKFAVVREDPQPETDCAGKLNARRVLLVASGGCTAFALQNQQPQLQTDLFDINPDQLQHVASRAQAIASSNFSALNINDRSPSGLSQSGTFEKFFRIFRQTFVELVASTEDVERFFQSVLPTRRQLLATWQASRFWQPLFHICFNDEFLIFLFGPEAVQHAEKNSYIDYFRLRFESGLYRHDSNKNYFLHSIFLGNYPAAFAPPFLTSGKQYPLTYYLSPFTELPDISQYDLVSLSNILDWCDQKAINRHAEALKAMKPGSMLILRQLNNQQSLRPLLQPAFSFDDALSQHYLATDRSFFYSNIEIATRMASGGQQ